MLNPAPYEERLRWFHQARFGMFIHFGLYSLLERGEWVMFRERIRPADYAKLADHFAPEQFDPREWARVAVEAGMKYAVFTARHHDGFCLYDSAVSDFTSVKKAAKRDFVAEYVEAFREAASRLESTTRCSIGDSPATSSRGNIPTQLRLWSSRSTIRFAS